MGETHNFKLSFMSWLKPDAQLPELVDLAVRYGYQAIEPRVGSDHAHGVELATAAEQLWDVRRAFEDSSLELSCLATGLQFAMDDAEQREKNVEELKRYVELADTVGAPYVRIFGGPTPDGFEKAGVIDYVSDALAEAVAHAESYNAVILLETHDHFVNSVFVREVIKQVYSEKLGVCWDVAHPVRAIETLEETYDNISGSVRHIHVHDYSYNDDRTKIEHAPLGDGFVRYDRAIEMLAHDLFEGCLSVEVMGQDAETVLPQYAEQLNAYVAAVSGEGDDVAEAAGAESGEEPPAEQ